MKSLKLYVNVNKQKITQDLFTKITDLYQGFFVSLVSISMKILGDNVHYDKV